MQWLGWTCEKGGVSCRGPHGADVCLEPGRWCCTGSCSPCIYLPGPVWTSCLRSLLGPFWGSWDVTLHHHSAQVMTKKIGENELNATSMNENTGLYTQFRISEIIKMIILSNTVLCWSHLFAVCRRLVIWFLSCCCFAVALDPFIVLLYQIETQYSCKNSMLIK